jgi:hypothetical protein
MKRPILNSAEASAEPAAATRPPASLPRYVGEAEPDPGQTPVPNPSVTAGAGAAGPARRLFVGTQPRRRSSFAGRSAAARNRIAVTETLGADAALSAAFWLSSNRDCP